jgi:hypothetical protein
MRRGQRDLWVGLLLLLTLASPAFAFPPQSIELMPGYKIADSVSDGAGTGQIRYFVHFASLYLATGIGIGHLTAPANHRNLALDSNIKMMPIAFTVRLTPPYPEWFPFFLEVGIDHLSNLKYQLDPTVDTGRFNSCETDIQTGPPRCTVTTLKKRLTGYHVGAGLETTFKSGFGIGLHYMYLFANPLEQTIVTTDAIGIQPLSVKKDDLFKINFSIFSLLLTYHF